MRYPSLRHLVLAASVAVISMPTFAAGTQSVDAAWTAAMKANDIDAIMKIYAADAVAWFPNEKEARGTAAIRATYEGLLSANTVTAANISDTGHRTVGKTSVGWGKFSLTLQPKAGGNPVVMVGRFTEVLERRNGRWVYLVDHASAEPAPVEPAK